LRSTVELMKCLAINNKVLYVDYAYTLPDLIRGITGRKRFAWQRVAGLKNRLQKISGDEQCGLYVLSLPATLPVFGTSSYKIFNILSTINASITGFFINKAIRKLKLSDIIEFNAYQPFLGNRWKLNNVTFKVFYIYDEFSNVSYFKGLAACEEKRYADAADLVIVTSDVLKTRKEVASRPIAVVNNGVHFNAFYSKIPNRSSLVETGHKVVGYTGNIDNRLDAALIERVIQAMPTTAFVFIGKVFDSALKARLEKNRNILFKSPVPAADIPDLLAGMDAGIIPYVCNNLTAAIYPLKANEYLAMGLPVVMTSFASLAQADSVVDFADSPESFKSALELALSANSDAQRNARIAVARAADWTMRANQLINHILQYKSAKQMPISEYQTH